MEREREPAEGERGQKGREQGTARANFRFKGAQRGSSLRSDKQERDTAGEGFGRGLVRARVKGGARVQFVHASPAGFRSRRRVPSHLGRLFLETFDDRLHLSHLRVPLLLYLHFSHD